MPNFMDDMQLIGGLDEEGLSYEFNTLQVWKDEDGRLYWATSSGCSCPTPFEEYSSKDDLHPLVRETFEEFEAEVKGFPATVPEKWRLLGDVEKEGCF